VDVVIHRFDVLLVSLDPAKGNEMQKTRPCVVVTPDAINRFVRTVLVAPLTTVMRKYPSRVNCRVGGRQGQIALDQIRCIDQSRVQKHLGRLDSATQSAVANTLVAMFTL
jgi:mRNA interferase MazF